MNNDLTLFETFVLLLCRNQRNFEITAELYGPRTYQLGAFTFSEYAPNVIVISSKDFYYKATNINEVIRIMNAIRY